MEARMTLEEIFTNEFLDKLHVYMTEIYHYNQFPI